MAAGKYRFSFGPWNISQGSDPFGPVVRKEVQFAKKIARYRELGFTYVQLHDDDVVPADWDVAATAKGVAKVKKLLDSEGLKAEFIAPRLWEDERTIDGLTVEVAIPSRSGQNEFVQLVGRLIRVEGLACNCGGRQES